jgi:hypothetical protein
MYIYTIKCTHCIYNYSQPCLTFLTSCILIAYNNYITARINLVANQRLFCNKCMTLSNTYDHATCMHFHIPIYIWHFNLFATSKQLYFKLKIWNLGKKPLSKWHMAIYQQICPNASMTFMRLCLWGFLLLLKVEGFYSYS